METTPESAPLIGADDARLVALRPTTATRAGSGSSRSLARLFFPKSFVWGEYAAFGRADAAAARELLRRRRPEARVDPRRRRRPTFVWGGGRLADAWPADAGRERVQPRAAVERRDAPDRRRAGLRDAAAGRDEGAAAVPAERPPGRAAGVRPLDDVLDAAAGGRHAGWSTRSSTRGKVDTSLYKPQTVDFTPEVTQTALAKGIAGGDGRPRGC